MSTSATAKDHDRKRMTAMLGNNSIAVRIATATKAPPLAVLRSAQMLVPPREKNAFAAELTSRLQAAEIDTSEAIAFELDDRGRVKARAGTPRKARIDALFAADLQLGNAYRRIANTEELKAQVREMSRYTLANATAGSQSDREA